MTSFADQLAFQIWLNLTFYFVNNCSSCLVKGIVKYLVLSLETLLPKHPQSIGHFSFRGSIGSFVVVVFNNNHTGFYSWLFYKRIAGKCQYIRLQCKQAKHCLTEKYLPYEISSILISTVLVGLRKLGS